MSKLPLDVKRDWMPRAWRAAFAAARSKGVPEPAFALIRAAAEKTLPAADWNLALTGEALAVLTGLPHAATRIKHIERLRRKYLPPAYAIVGRGVHGVRIIQSAPRGVYITDIAGHLRASGSREYIQNLLRYALACWASLPMGREIEAAAEELAAARERGRAKTEFSTAAVEAAGQPEVPGKSAGVSVFPPPEFSRRPGRGGNTGTGTFPDRNTNPHNEP